MSDAQGGGSVDRMTQMGVYSCAPVGVGVQIVFVIGERAQVLLVLSEQVLRRFYVTGTEVGDP